MDYGQPISNPDKEPIFSPDSSMDNGDNLGDALIERDFGNIGNAAINSSENKINGTPVPKSAEQIASTPEFTPAPNLDPSFGPQIPELGEPVELESPSNPNKPNPVDGPKSQSSPAKTVQSIIDKIRQSDDISSAYESYVAARDGERSGS